ncbi:MAG: hypothetical protein M1827_007618 [Pycnora praestabilis]|nr:MAG: hypothetical protein M1827_007618 [Pycnora praestabilis]
MGKSSKDKRDAYYRLAKEQGWRARSAYKLLQIDEEFNLFTPSVTRVVDLCAAPGSWSQVLSRVLIKGEKFGRAAWEDTQRKEEATLQQLEKRENGEGPENKNVEEDSPKSEKEELRPRKDVKIVSIDLQPMTPLEGITMLKADITHPSTVPRLLQALNPDTLIPSSTTTSETSTDPPSTSHLVDLVICDGAPDVTGLHDLDIYIQSSLLFSALSLTLRVLKPGPESKFVAKIFRGKDVDLLYAQLKVVFEKVTVAKPRSSRASSIEAFVVCEGFYPPPGDWMEQLGGSLGPRTKIPPNSDHSAKEKKAKGQTRTVRPDGIVELILGLSDDENEDSEDGIGTRWIAPFLACGDLSAWDADATYHLPKDRQSLDPVQPPTAPPYKRALEMRRAAGGMNGKTGRS